MNKYIKDKNKIKYKKLETNILKILLEVMFREMIESIEKILFNKKKKNRKMESCQPKYFIKKDA